MAKLQNESLMKHADSTRYRLACDLLSGLEKLFGDTPVPVKASDLYNTLEKPPEAKLGDYAFPCFRFAGPLKMPPPKVSQELAKILEDNKSEAIDNIQVVGPFLNIFVKTTFVLEPLLSAIASGEFFNAIKNHGGYNNEKVMIEYSQPNTHKDFHVGHMRNICLGSALTRLYAYSGYETTPVNYIGDDGTHIAKTIWYMERFDKKAPETGKGEWLGLMYVESINTIEDANDDIKKSYLAEVSEVHRNIESQSGHHYELWKTTRQWSLELFKEVYKWIDAPFDHDFFESDCTTISQNIVTEYLDKGVFIEDDGCIGIDLKDDKLGFLILRKSDGNTLYATKDLALAKIKFEKYAIDKSVYVVASEQNHHFKQVFKTLEKMGFDKAKNCYHLSYGMVRLPDGKMSSRKGTVIRFSTLKDSLSSEVSSLLEKYRGEWSDEEIVDTTYRLSTGAIQYGMLSTDPTRDVAFDLKDWLSFEGDTGPYLMYAYARSQSILRKAEEKGFNPSMKELKKLEDIEARELTRFIHDFNLAVWQATHQYKPSLLCNHLYEMCRVFSRFYSNVPMLKEQDEGKRSACLALTQGFSTTLKEGLRILGVTPPERM